MLYVALFVAGFGAVSSAIRRVTPWPSEYGQRAKWEYLLDHRDEFDVLFVGSSVTFYGIVPHVFDEVLAARGRPVRSFNMGVGGMTTLESDQFLRRVLELEPARLRFVFVEAENWDARIWAKKNTYAPRMVHWHTLEHTRLALESLSRTPQPPSPEEGAFWRWEEGWTHVTLCLRKLSGAGQGRRIVRSWLDLDRGEVRADVPELEELRGYVDLDRIQGEEWENRRADFLSKQEAYAERVARIDAQNAEEPPLDRHFNLDGLRSQIAAIRAAGAEPIYYTGPRLLDSPLEMRLAREGILPVLLAFNQPARYPELYDPANRFDQNHLKRKAAEEFSRQLAASFADHLDSAASD